MRPFFLLHTTGIALLALLLTSCGGSSSSGNSASVGPFDENGDYVEAWADNPPARKNRRNNLKNAEPETRIARKSSKREETSPKTSRESRQERTNRRLRELEAARQQRLAEAESKARAERAEAQRRARKVYEDQQAALRLEQAERLRQARAIQAQRANEILVATAPRPQSTQTTPISTVNPDAARMKALAAARARKAREAKAAQEKARRLAREKAAAQAKADKAARLKAAQAKAAAAKAPRYHRVQKKDTLYGLSQRYGTSVAAIRKANGLGGNTILTGSTLKIPK